MVMSSTENKRYCLGCRHSLQDLDNNQCPECDRKFDPNDPKTFSTRPRTMRVIDWIFLIALYAYVLALAGLAISKWIPES